jgi:hypothetical protein
LYQHLYSCINSYTVVATPIRLYQILYSCINSHTVVSIPIQLYQLLYSCISSFTVVSIPIQLYQLLCSCSNSYTVVSNPIQLYQLLYSCINSYTVVSTPLQLYQFLYSCIKSYSLKSCTVHYRVPEKEWSFQDGGRASLFKVGLVVWMKCCRLLCIIASIEYIRRQIEESFTSCIKELIRKFTDIHILTIQSGVNKRN